MNAIGTSFAQTDRGVEEFDLRILGGGTGSTVAAWTFAGEGQRVAVVDRQYVGGSCPNIACLPSRNIVQSARVDGERNYDSPATEGRASLVLADSFAGSTSKTRTGSGKPFAGIGGSG